MNIGSLRLVTHSAAFIFKTAKLIAKKNKAGICPSVRVRGLHASHYIHHDFYIKINVFYQPQKGTQL